jgi:hypothetical protein
VCDGQAKGGSRGRRFVRRRDGVDLLGQPEASALGKQFQFLLQRSVPKRHRGPVRCLEYRFDS